MPLRPRTRRPTFASANDGAGRRSPRRHACRRAARSRSRPVLRDAARRPGCRRAPRRPGRRRPLGRPVAPATNAMYRSKSAIGLDLKAPAGVDAFLRLTDGADATFEVFRPGVVERLGIGPDVCVRTQPAPRLRPPHRVRAGGPVGPQGRARHRLPRDRRRAGAARAAGAPPTPPINVLADFAGGGMLLAFGIVAALLARERTGAGQVVDAAMVDGAALMLTPFYAALASGFWGARGTNMLDRGAPSTTATRRTTAVGSRSERSSPSSTRSSSKHSASRASSSPTSRIASVGRSFVSGSRLSSGSAHATTWEAHFASYDVCVAPGTPPTEAPEHPHNRARDLSRHPWRAPAGACPALLAHASRRALAAPAPGRANPRRARGLGVRRGGGHRADRRRCARMSAGHE